MRATKFEFERRFWIISAFFFLGYFLFQTDVGAITAVRHLLAPGILPGTPQAATFNRIMIGIGALLVFLAAALRTWGAAYLRTDVVHDRGQHSEALVADGPFRYVRNPLYFANLPMAVGLGLLASRGGWIFIIATNWFFVYRLIFREEAALRETQGEFYRAYCRAVPRFWPALTPRVPSAGRVPRWGQAFAGETFIWLFGLAELCLALTLDLRLMGVVFAIAFIAHFIVMARVRRANAA